MVDAAIHSQVTHYLHIIETEPGNLEACTQLALLYEAQGFEHWAKLYRGEEAWRRGDYQAAADCWQEFLAGYWGDVGCYDKLIRCYLNLGQWPLAIATYYRAIATHPEASNFYFDLAWELRHHGFTSEARLVAALGAARLPKAGDLQALQHLLLPVVYGSTPELDWYRQQLSGGLQQLIQSIDLSTETGRAVGLSCLGWSTNFFLHYQGRDDLAIQKLYGAFVAGVMAANFTDLPPPQQSTALAKIRVGYVVGSELGRLLQGWLKCADRTQFVIYLYYLEPAAAACRQYLIGHSDQATYLDGNVGHNARQILADQLDILVFAELGLNVKMTQLAGLRLAPIQCTTWLHPITSGLPTIDYFLSNQAMEVSDRHYSETLVCLPGLGIILPPVNPLALTTRRADFGLPSDRLIYLGCQACQKYLPQEDELAVQICQNLPEALLVFIGSHWSSNIHRQWRDRLGRQFRRAGLDIDQHCRFLPRQSLSDYWQLLQLSDVFLDTSAWSGGLTSMDAVACALPIVTCPGEFFRGRQSAGILTSLGITETIASSPQEYVAIACRLGRDAAWRGEVKTKMQQAYGLSDGSSACMAALEDFYRTAIAHSACKRYST
jgi:hypothetical protein